MTEYASNEEFFDALRGLIRRAEEQGNASAARELREGMSCLNGLTDGWAMLLQSIDKSIREDTGRLGPAEMTELKAMRRSLRNFVSPGPATLLKNIFGL